MRPVCALLALTAAAGSARAQAWSTEVGVQGGWSRIAASGANQPNPLFALTLPGFSLGSSLPTPGALFVIVPIAGGLALEPGLSASQLGLLGSAATLGMRLNYALAGGLYASLGAVLAYRQANAATDVQPGVQAALGYRRPLSTTLRGRIELHWQAVRRSDAFTPKTVYSVLAGFSAPVRGTGPPAPTGAGWRPTIGFQGGYANYHMTGLGGFTFLAAPGLGGAMYLGTPFPIVLPPTIFVTVPLGGRVAAEIGLDVNRLQRSDSSQLAVNTLIRLDYAFDRHWYAAAGVALHTLTQTGASSATVAGLAAAAGYRFSLVGALGGRVEMSYTAMQRNVRFAVASETLAILVGMTLPLR